MHSGRFSQARGHTDRTEVTQAKEAWLWQVGFPRGRRVPGSGLRMLARCFLIDMGKIMFPEKMSLNCFWFGDMELSVSHYILSLLSCL